MTHKDDIKNDRVWLMLGKCQERMKDIPNATGDCFFITLPYGSTDADWDIPIFEQIPPELTTEEEKAAARKKATEEFWAEVKRTRKPGAAICFFANATLATSLIETNKKEFRNLIAWAKPEAVDPANKNRFRSASEFIVIFCDKRKFKFWKPILSKGEYVSGYDNPEKSLGASVASKGMYSKHNESAPCHEAANGEIHILDTKKVGCPKCGAEQGMNCTKETKRGKKRQMSAVHSERIRVYEATAMRCDACDVAVSADDIVYSRYPTNVRYFPQDTAPLGEDKHETPNPVCIASYFIDCFSKPGDTIIDITMGHGSTGVAAVNMGRYFIGIEMRYDPFYYAGHRIQDTTLGSNKEYEIARKQTNNFSQPRELLAAVELWRERAERHEKELRGYKELAEKAVLAALLAHPEGLLIGQVREFSGLGGFTDSTLERLLNNGIVVKNQTHKGARIFWTLKQEDAQANAATASGD